MRKMGLAEIQKFCGLRTSNTPSRKKTKPRRTLSTAAQARKTQLIQSLRRGTPWMPSVMPNDDDDDDDDDDGHIDEDYMGYGEDLYDEVDTDDSSYDSNSSSSSVSMDRTLVQVQLKPHSAGSSPSEKKVSSSSSEIFTASSVINEKSLVDESPKPIKVGI